MIDRSYDSYSREELMALLRERDQDEAGGLRLHYKIRARPVPTVAEAVSAALKL